MSNRAAPRSLDENAVIRRLSLVSLIGNALLSAFKLLAGVWGHFGAMISDAIHSFSDVLTTFIAWFGVKVSRRAADASHPYGHERLECVASLILGIVLMGKHRCGPCRAGDRSLQPIRQHHPAGCHCPGSGSAVHHLQGGHVLVHPLLRQTHPFRCVPGGCLASPFGCILLRRSPHWYRGRHAGLPGDGLGGQCGHLSVHPQGGIRHPEGRRGQDAGYLLRGTVRSGTAALCQCPAGRCVWIPFIPACLAARCMWTWKSRWTAAKRSRKPTPWQGGCIMNWNGSSRTSSM